MASTRTKSLIASAGGVAAAAGSALCCAGPLVAVLLGVSGAGLASTFEPLRPYFVFATIAALAAAWTLFELEERRACTPDSLCASPRERRWMRWFIIIATVLAIPLLTFSWWSRFVMPTG